jgi:hypothetical protein
MMFRRVVSVEPEPERERRKYVSDTPAMRKKISLAVLALVDKYSSSKSDRG